MSPKVLSQKLRRNSLLQPDSVVAARATPNAQPKGKKSKGVLSLSHILKEVQERIDKKKKRMKAKEMVEELSIVTLSKGMLLLGRVNQIEDLQLVIALPGGLTGIVPLTNISKEYTSSLRSSLENNTHTVRLRDLFKIGQSVATKVTKIVREKSIVKLSLVPEAIYADVNHSSNLRGTVFYASVASVTGKRYTMNLGVKSTRAFLEDSRSLAYRRWWNKGKPFSVGEIVPCAVTKWSLVDDLATVILTAIPSLVADSVTETSECLVPGVQFAVTVIESLDNALRVRFSDDLIGYVQGGLDNFKEGCEALGKISHVLPDGTVYFSLKDDVSAGNRVKTNGFKANRTREESSSIDNDLEEAYKLLQEIESSATRIKRSSVSESTEGERPKKRKIDESSEVKGKKGTDSKGLKCGKGEMSVKSAKKKAVVLPGLSATSSFVWDATFDQLPVVARAEEEESSDDEAEPASKEVKRSRAAIVAEKRLLAQQEESRLRQIENRLMDSDQPPQSADEFDRLVLSSPDSSMVWLQYMAYHLQATEIEKARSVGQRALKTIAFREEQEKLNVWMALLNLENLYGTKDSLENTLNEAVKANDSYQVHTQLLEIYADSHKLLEADKLIAVMTKRYKTSREMWFNAATYYMKSGQLEKARALLQRALASLEKKEHVDVISRFAQLENKLGSSERAQTLMEQILTSYPRRVDVWSSYVDMLVKSDLIQMARQVLERAVVQRLPSHKMKTLFKKFLAFEQAQGNEEGADKVRQMALNYVESTAGNGLT